MEPAGHREVVELAVGIGVGGGSGEDPVEFETVGPVHREDGLVDLARRHLEDVAVQVHREGIVRHLPHGEELGGAQSRKVLTETTFDEHVELEVGNASLTPPFLSPSLAYERA